jgi:hypothetical protein
MRNLLILLSILFSLPAYSQQGNPFADLGFKRKVKTLTKNKYVEFHEDKDIEQIGTALYDTRTKKVIGFVKIGANKNENMPSATAGTYADPDRIGGFFPTSPYAAMNCNPILYNDPTGASGERVIHGTTMTITSDLYFYGGATGKIDAALIAQKTQDAWNAAGGTSQMNGKTYNVEFVINGHVMTGSENEIKNTIQSNTDIKNNYFRVEDNFDNAIPKSNGGFVTTGELTGHLRGDAASGGNTAAFGPKALSTSTRDHGYAHSLGGTHIGPSTISDANNYLPVLFPIGGAYKDMRDGGSGDGNLTQDGIGIRKISQEDFNNIDLGKNPGSSGVGSLTNKYIDAKGNQQ